MAEYYPLLAKAVAGLQNSTPEIRRAVYERAHKALLAQLKNLDPPIAESDVARETDALAGAVARLEAELASANGHAGDRPEAPAQKPSPQRPAPQRASSQGTPPQGTPSQSVASVEPAANAAASAAPSPGASASRPIMPPRRDAGSMPGQAASSQPVPSQGVSAQRPSGQSLPGAAARPPRPMPSASSPSAAKLAVRQNPTEQEAPDISPVKVPAAPRPPEPPAQKSGAGPGKGQGCRTS